MGFFDKLKQGLKKTKDTMMKQVDNMVKSFRKIDEEFFEELEDVLIMSDVGAQTAHKICEELADRVKSRKVEDPEEITGMLKELLIELMSGAEELRLHTKPSVILVIGVNGVGKTTSIGKMAARLREQGKSVILGAADTFRAAAIDQLQVWADRAGVKMIRAGEGSDPASVVFDTISAAKAARSDVIICDTAGRLHNKKNLMDELAKINRVIGRELPDSDLEVLLVLDATTGQNAVNQAIQFKEAAGITGIILTKLDGTAKGGVVIAIQDSLGIPVKFVGVGEQLDDMQPFDAKQFVEALFD